MRLLHPSPHFPSSSGKGKQAKPALPSPITNIKGSGARVNLCKGPPRSTTGKTKSTVCPTSTTSTPFPSFPPFKAPDNISSISSNSGPFGLRFGMGTLQSSLNASSTIQSSLTPASGQAQCALPGGNSSKKMGFGGFISTQRGLFAPSSSSPTLPSARGLLHTHQQVSMDVPSALSSAWPSSQKKLNPPSSIM